MLYRLTACGGALVYLALIGSFCTLAAMMLCWASVFKFANTFRHGRVFVIDDAGTDCIVALKSVFGVNTTEEVVNRSVALANICARHADANNIVVFESAKGNIRVDLAG